MNRILLYGKLATNVMIKKTPNGNKVVCFNIKVLRNPDNLSSVADMFEVEAWNDLAIEIEEEAKVGCNLWVRGRLLIQTWQDRFTKKTKIKYTISAYDVGFGQVPETMEAFIKAIPNTDILTGDLPPVKMIATKRRKKVGLIHHDDDTI